MTAARMSSADPRLRKDVAMTGEITLRGRVLPIGGLKEKLLAALRGGVKRAANSEVLIPIDNEKDLAEIPDNVKKGLEIIPVSTVEEALKEALVRAPTAIEWDEDETDEKVPTETSDGTRDGVTTH